MHLLISFILLFQCEARTLPLHYGFLRRHRRKLRSPNKAIKKQTDNDVVGRKSYTTITVHSLLYCGVTHTK